MRDEVYFATLLIIGVLLFAVFYTSIGKAWDQEFGDYRKNNVQYLNKTK